MFELEPGEWAVRDKSGSPIPEGLPPPKFCVSAGDRAAVGWDLDVACLLCAHAAGSSASGRRSRKDGCGLFSYSFLPSWYLLAQRHFLAAFTLSQNPPSEQLRWDVATSV